MYNIAHGIVVMSFDSYVHPTDYEKAAANHNRWDCHKVISKYGQDGKVAVPYPSGRRADKMSYCSGTPQICKVPRGDDIRTHRNQPGRGGDHCSLTTNLYWRKACNIRLPR